MPIGAWLRTLAGDGVQPHEIGVFVRSSDQVPRATAAVKAAGLSPRVLDDRVDVQTWQRECRHDAPGQGP